MSRSTVPALAGPVPVGPGPAADLSGAQGLAREPSPDGTPHLTSTITLVAPGGTLLTAPIWVTPSLGRPQTVSLRQVTRRVPARHGGTRQIHALTSRTDLAAGEVCWRLTSRWREENYFRYARTHFALEALDSHAAAPDDPGWLVPNPAKKAAAAQALAALCDHLNQAASHYPGTNLVLRYQVKPHPGIA